MLNQWRERRPVHERPVEVRDLSWAYKEWGAVKQRREEGIVAARDAHEICRRADVAGSGKRGKVRIRPARRNWNAACPEEYRVHELGGEQVEMHGVWSIKIMCMDVLNIAAHAQSRGLQPVKQDQRTCGPVPQ